MLRRMTSRPSALSIARDVRGGVTSAHDVVRAALERADAVQGALNSFIHLDPSAALAAAAEVDARIAAGGAELPLAGVPIAVKDNIATADMPTTAASRILGGYTSPFDATIVAKLKASGAVVIGKTNLDEFGMGATGENSAFGPSLNPRDPERVAGGSSSGSAAAVGAGVVPLALGTDTGGSSRLPAAYCGVVGFKPSFGAVSRYGLLAYASSLEQAGILAASVEDVALTLSVVAGVDPADALTFPLQGAPQGTPGGAGLAGKRIGVIPELAGEGFGEDALGALGRARSALEELGAELVEVSVPTVGYAVACYHVIAAAEASSNLARYAGMLYGAREGSDGEGQESVMRRTRGALLGREAKRRILLGSFALSAGQYDLYYGRALKVRGKLSRELAAALGQVDAVLTPTAPGVAPQVGGTAADPVGAYLADVATCLANLAGLPAITVPSGSGEEGLPLGAQLLGAAGADYRLLALAGSLERALGADS